MTHEQREQRIARLLEHAARLREVKGHDYSSGDDVMENLKIDGSYGCVIRLQDKTTRMRAICKKGCHKVPDERFSDSAVDAVNYALFAAILNEDERKRIIDDTDGMAEVLEDAAKEQSGDYID